MPTKKGKAEKKYNYEMILQWQTDKKPFTMQKLGFVSNNSMLSLALDDALQLLKLIVNVGGYNRKQVKLMAVSHKAALQTLLDEQYPSIKKNKASIDKIIAKAKTLKVSSKKNKHIGSNVIKLRG